MNNKKLLEFLQTAKGRMDGGEHEQALKVLKSALGLDPEPWLRIEIYFQMALCRCELEDYAGAAGNLETALALSDDAAYADKKHIYDILLIVYTRKPDYEKLSELCRMLINIEEDKTSLVLSLIFAYMGSKKWNELALVFDDYPYIDETVESLHCKVLCFIMIGRYNEAFKSVEKYIERFGEDYKIYTNLMNLYFCIGDDAKGFEYYKKAIKLCDAPDLQLDIRSRLLIWDLYNGTISDNEFPDIVNDMRLSTEKLQANTIFVNTPKPFRKIRLGFLSTDFREHPVGFFLLPVMKNTVTSHCSNYCFNLAQRNDEYNPVTTQFKSLADVWEEVHERPDSYIEQLFLTNEIDIAFDMMCHTDNNRLQLYARRLAPVQISWMGLPVTTGVAAMDYVITDKNADPPGSEKYYTEKLLYMPDTFLCTTLSGSPRVDPPAFTRNGFITFACFHNLKKITDKTLRMWRAILERRRDSHIKIMGHMPSGELNHEMFNERFEKIGLPMERVSVSPTCDIRDYFTAYNDVDIMLDTYPFSGATTTFDALRMGRPIITLVGERHVSRVSYCLLKHVGHENLAAFSEDEYVEKAVALANDYERLCKINADLPRQVMSSPFINQPAFRGNFEKIIRDAWTGYCFENRVGDYDYGVDSPQELLEQVVNATVYIERKLDAGEEPDSALMNEYLKVQKAFYEKLKTTIDNEDLILGYGKLIELIGLVRHGFDAEKNIRQAVVKAKQYLNTFYNRDLHVAAGIGMKYPG